MFSPLSIEITKSFDKNTLKEYGIYFTPKPILDLCLEQAYLSAEEHGIRITEILEPSCGSCEFVLAASARFPEAHIDCVEYNASIYNNITNLQSERIDIYNADYLSWTNDTGKKYDLVIGNPPYFVIKKDDVPEAYHRYLQGRPNIYTLFIHRGIDMLSDSGVLSFVIPTNFLNCTYYSKTRDYILNNLQIKSIIVCDDGGFIDTEQQTVIFTVAKVPMSSERLVEMNQPYVLSLPSGGYIFSTAERVAELKNLYRDSITLNDLGINVSVGTVVWNQCDGNEKKIQKKKEEDKKKAKGENSDKPQSKRKTSTTASKKETFELSDDPADTLLIYSSNIVDGRFVEQQFKNEEKKCYIKKEGITGPTMVINRGYGKGVYKMNYSIIDMNRPYLIENHLICLTPNDEVVDVMETYRMIEKSLNDPRTARFIELYFGNNAINCSELKNSFPIYP